MIIKFPNDIRLSAEAIRGYCYIPPIIRDGSGEVMVDACIVVFINYRDVNIVCDSEAIAMGIMEDLDIIMNRPLMPQAMKLKFAEIKIISYD